MRFLVDECTGYQVAAWLRGQGHEVFSVYDEARGMSDEEILAKAVAEEWVVITNDKDFGDLVFRRKRPHKGIIFLRLDDDRAANKIAALERVFAGHADDLIGRYTIVREHLVRVSPG
jgi:predicted nuclease of predicted toxin-antitoxin system